MARQNMGVCMVDGKIYVIGGTRLHKLIFSTVNVYDPATDTWTIEDGMPGQRAGLSADLVNGKIYAIGGWTTPGYSGLVSTVEEWDLSLKSP